MDKKGKRFTIDSAGIRTKLRAAAISKGRLGFGPIEMGAHSLRYITAMEMYLAVVSPLKIMIIRRWRSDALLLYIQKQAAQFPTKLWDKILQNK